MMKLIDYFLTRGQNKNKNIQSMNMFIVILIIIITSDKVISVLHNGTYLTFLKRILQLSFF